MLLTLPFKRAQYLMYLSCKAKFYQICHIFAVPSVALWKTLCIEPK